MAQVIEERYIFTMKRFPDGQVWCTPPKLIGQGYAKPKEQKQPTKGMETENICEQKKDLFKV
jgi:hypothetical protein